MDQSSPSSARSATRFIAISLSVAAAYAGCGWLSLFLAIPPGFASPIWPASGIALAAVLTFGYHYLPAVFLGSLAINLFIGLRGSTPESLVGPGLVAASIASGAALQGFASAWLIRRFVRFPYSLESFREIALILILGGPIGCLSSAAIGSSTLVASGLTAQSNWLANGYTWWIGDTLGVACFCPTFLLLLARRSMVRIQRKFAVAAIQAAVFGLLVLGLERIRESESQRLRIEFENNAASISDSLERIIQTQLSVLIAIDSLYQASDSVTRDDFRTFTSRFIAESPKVHAISWNARVTHEERAEFEAAMRFEGYSGYTIKDALAPGQFVTAPDRPLYFPITHVSPLRPNQAALGFDTYLPVNRRKILDDSILTRQTISTGRLNIVQATDREGLLLYRPVFRRVENLDTNSPKESFIGFAAGVFIIDELLSDILQKAKVYKFNLALHDHSQPENSSLLHETINAQDCPAGVQRFSTTIALGVTRWELIFTENALDALTISSWRIWATLVGGSLSLSMLGVLLLTLTGRTETVQRSIDQRTLELKNKSLEAERLATEAERLATEAAAANLAKSQFLAAMSHEIRTPMNGLMGVLDLLEGDLPADKHPLLTTAHRSANELLYLINDILDLSKIEAGKMSLETVEFNLPKLVGEICELHLPNAQAKGIKLHAEVDPSARLQCSGDPYRLRQILSNLVGNAVKFTNNGSVQLKADTRKANDGSTMVVFKIQDTGIGISAEQRSCLFQSFSQADSSTTRNFGGTGLGLSISKKLIELMGGEISVQSEVGKGTDFTVALPQPDSASLPLVENAEPAKDSQESPQDHKELSHLRVLLVDDNPTNRMIALALLKTRFEIEATFAVNGQEAIGEMLEAEFDLVLMDCMMPVMDGYAATGEIRSGQAGPSNVDVPVIALTANAMASDREVCMNAGMTDYLSKPLRPAELQEMLQKWKGRRHGLAKK